MNNLDVVKYNQYSHENRFKNKGFSKSQEELLNRLEDFTKNDEPTFTVNGSAGTGKTFIMNYFCHNIIKGTYCVTAPTHKALRVIEKTIGRKGKTLQSLHGLRPNVNLEDFNIDNIKFDLLGTPQMSNYKYVIVDEASMIGKDLNIINTQRAKSFGTKIIYVGDICQLPPVKEQCSQVFANKNIYTLTDVIRQNHTNPLLDILIMLRDDIINNTSNAIQLINSKKDNINSDGEGYEFLNIDNFSSKVISTFNSNEFKTNLQYSRYLGYTNDNIESWNEHIRNKIIPDYNNTFSINDMFTGYNTLVDPNLNHIITNSDDYIVNSIYDRICDYGFKIYNIVLQNIYTKTLTPTISVVDHKDKSFAIYYKLLNSLHQAALYSTPTDKSKHWRNYYNFKEQYLTAKSFTFGNGDNYRGTVKKDIDHGFGITVHKSQGSTYTNILVNATNILYYFDENKKRIPRYYHADKRRFVNQLLYVALSRATTKATILI
jgi:exodeoxyribonuclease-5